MAETKDEHVSQSTSREHRALHGRLLSRAQALQLLFQAENAATSVAEVLASDYMVSEGPADAFARLLALGCFEQKKALDEVLQAVTTHWEVERIAQVDKEILRLALYEILFAEDIAKRSSAFGIDLKDACVDAPIAASEAVRLAKIFGGDASYQFVNGILGRIIRDRAQGADFLQKIKRDEGTA